MPARGEREDRGPREPSRENKRESERRALEKTRAVRAAIEAALARRDGAPVSNNWMRKPARIAEREVKRDTGDKRKKDDLKRRVDNEKGAGGW
ncbi:hypothetical protein M2103_000813 [Ereboglobus sp. PH5-5]|nr:hypothetical protein [Ereboglobus sp. PH5-5]